MSIRMLSVILCGLAACVPFTPGAVANANGTAAALSCATAQRTLAAHNRAGGMLRFHDSIEDTRGPDICGDNMVTNDNENTVTFGLHIHNRGDFAPSEAYGVFLDTDLNQSTGGAGAEYRVRLTREATILGKWDGTRFAELATLEPATWKRGFGPVFRLNTKDVDGVRTFNFVFFSTDGFNGDLAPNRGAWSYQLAPLELGVRGLTAGRARAGRLFNAQMTVVRSDLGELLADGTIACGASLGSKSLTGAGRFAAGRIVCTWRLPKSARGKRFSGSIAVTYQGVEAKRSFATKVR